MSAPENIDLEELRESEDAAGELVASFGTPAPVEYAAPVEPAPVDALLGEVYDSVDSYDAAEPVVVESAVGSRPSGRRAAGPPQDAAPRTRAENRASLRDAPPEDDRDENTALPGDLNVDEFPDLASALRAAGRTADEPKPQPQPRPMPEPQPGLTLDPRPIPAPRPSAENTRRRARRPRSTYVPDSPAALLDTPAPPTQSRPQPRPQAQPQIRPEARLRPRNSTDIPLSQGDSLAERTARQVAAFQAEAYPGASSAASSASSAAGPKRPRPAQGRHPAQPANPGPTPAPRAQSVLPERAQRPHRPQTRAQAQAQARIPEQTPAKPTGRRSQQENPQVNGSVLSPRTWRQGVDALRDLTVRRG